MKRSLSLILSICLVLTLFAGIVPAAGAVTYTDVKKADWSYDAIYYLTDKNVLAGDGTGRFRPTNKVTHIEFIKMMVAAFGLKETTRVSYTDVPAWAKEGLYLEKAAAQGFLLDYAKDFDFESKLTREEAVALLMRYLDLDEETNMASTSRVPDYAKISSKYRTYALTAVGAGVIKGDEKGNFNPQDVLTREQALQILYNAAGAIYTKSAISADTNAPKTNATINNAANISGITFAGNVYITEDVSAVYLKNCFITGELFVRGDTEVIIEDSIVNYLTVKGAGAELELDGDTEVNTMNVNATAEIELDEDALVKKMLFNTGSRNSSVTGEGEIVNIAVRDHGITTAGVKITDEYYIYPGYTATFDGIVYTEGTGKHMASNIVSATVSGSATSSYGTQSSINFSVKTNATGTLYVVAWKKTEATLNANSIANTIGSTSSLYARTSQSVTANVTATFSLAVNGSYADYNVGMIFVPYGSTISADKLIPYYNKSTITAVATAMTTDAPAKSDSTAPTWTLSSSSTTAYNILTVTFNQAMYYQASSSAVPQALAALNSTTLAGLVSVDTGVNRLTNYTVVADATSTTLTLYFAKGALTYGVNYTVAISGNLVNGTGTAADVKAATVAFGSSTAAGLTAPTLSCTASGSSVSASDSLYISIPAGASRVAYQITVDGTEYPVQTITTATRIYFSSYSSANVISVTAYAVDSYGNALGATASGTYYLGTLPIIYVDDVACAGTGKTVKVSGNYYISVGSAGSTANTTAYYFVDGVNVGYAYNFTGNYNVTTAASKTFTIRYVNNYSQAVVAETSVTVVYEAASGGYVSSAPTPTVSSNYSNLIASQPSNISSTHITISVPSATGYYYSYSIDGLTGSNLATGDQYVQIFGDQQYNVTRTITITAKTAAGVTAGIWSWIITRGTGIR